MSDVSPRLSTGLFNATPSSASFRSRVKKHRLGSNPHGIAIGIKAIQLLDRSVVNLEQLIATNQGAYKEQQGALGEMEIRE
jgi:hypothetical protein